jgi:hydroxypyruvate reductase
MLELPKPGLCLDELQSITHSLLRSGAPIEHVNTVRTALSQSKGGGLVRMAAPAQVVGLILSDVVGNSLEAIASGPTVTGALDAVRPRQLLKKHQLWESLPRSIRQAINTHPEPLPENPAPINIIIGSNRLLVEAAQEKASELGFDPYHVVHDLVGEAREAGETIARELLECPPECCLILGGETTVRVLGEGIGGRNQELALAAAIKLDGNPRAALLSAASDGIDGPTDAAGGWVDGGAIQDAKALGIDTKQALDENDSHTLLNHLGRLIKTGPTGTNVNDLVVGLKYTNGESG